MEQGLCSVEPRAQHGEERRQASEPETQCTPCGRLERGCRTQPRRKYLAFDSQVLLTPESTPLTSRTHCLPPLQSPHNSWLWYGLHYTLFYVLVSFSDILLRGETLSFHFCMFNGDSYNARPFRGEGCIWVRAVRASWAGGLGWEEGWPGGWKGLERAEPEGDKGQARTWGQAWGTAGVR